MIWPLSEGGRGLADSTRSGAARAGLGTAMTAASIVPASRRSKRTENIGSTPLNAFTEFEARRGTFPDWLIACVNCGRNLGPARVTRNCFYRLVTIYFRSKLTARPVFKILAIRSD